MQTRQITCKIIHIILSKIILMIEFTLMLLPLLNGHLDVEVTETTGGVWESKREILYTGHSLAIADHYKRKSWVIFSRWNVHTCWYHQLVSF